MPRAPAPDASARVLIVDDSAVVRGLLARVVDAEPDMRVVATAFDGSSALEVLRRRDVDVVLLDVDMPGMDGITALPLILQEHAGVRVIMVSSLTRHGAEVTVQALALGAADYLPKPSATRPGQALAAIEAALVRKIRALAPSGGTAAPPSPPAPFAATPAFTAGRTAAPPEGQPVEAIGIASSTGGPNALVRLLAALPPDVRAPILVAQHMPPVFTEHLADRLARETGRPCAEARDGELVLPGRAYVAPGGRHLLVRRDAAVRVLLADTPPENFCRPSADPLFRSLAEAFGPASAAVVLTGMGHDGLDGARAVAAAGGRVLVQDPASSVVWGMPGAVARAGLALAALPPEGLAHRLARLAGVTS